MMFGDTGAWNTLMDKFSRTIRLSQCADQSRAQAVQLFDSWVMQSP